MQCCLPTCIFIMKRRTTYLSPFNYLYSSLSGLTNSAGNNHADRLGMYQVLYFAISFSTGGNFTALLRA